MVTCFLCTEALCDMLLHPCAISFPRLQKVVTYDLPSPLCAIQGNEGSAQSRMKLRSASWELMTWNQVGVSQALFIMRLNSFSIPWLLHPPCMMGVSCPIPSPGMAQGFLLL